MKVLGLSYLQRTLQSCIDEIFEAQKPCEIDTSRLTPDDNVEINKVSVAIWIRISHSLPYCVLFLPPFPSPFPSPPTSSPLPPFLPSPSFSSPPTFLSLPLSSPSLGQSAVLHREDSQCHHCLSSLLPSLYVSSVCHVEGCSCAKVPWWEAASVWPQHVLLSWQYLYTLDKRDVVCYTAVSGFVFLRFFAPAILNPKLFNLRHENPVSLSPWSVQGLVIWCFWLRALGWLEP